MYCPPSLASQTQPVSARIAFSIKHVSFPVGDTESDPPWGWLHGSGLRDFCYPWVQTLIQRNYMYMYMCRAEKWTKIETAWKYNLIGAHFLAKIVCGPHGTILFLPSQRALTRPTTRTSTCNKDIAWSYVAIKRRAMALLWACMIIQELTDCCLYCVSINACLLACSEPEHTLSTVVPFSGLN